MKRFPKADNKSQTLTYLFVCIGLVLAFSLTLIYPYTLSLAKMDREIEGIKSRIKEQNVLYPFYLDLQKKMMVHEPEGFSLPRQVALPADETAIASDDFQQIADRNQMQLLDAVPDVDSLISGSGYVTMNVVLLGDLPRIHNFLLQIGALPYLEKIEKIQIQEMTDREELELRLEVVIAQEIKKD